MHESAVSLVVIFKADHLVCFSGHLVQGNHKTPSRQEVLRYFRRCYKENTIYSLACKGDTRGCL